MISIKRENNIKQIKSLEEFCEYMTDDDNPESNWRKNYEALDQVIKELESEVTGDGAADLIKKAIEKEGINQKILAERTGITRQNVSQMLNRGKNCMRYDSFEKLVKVLGYEVILRKNL